MKLLFTLGGGGHTTEMVKLIGLLGNEHEYFYVLVKEVQFARGKIPHPGKVYEVRRPRGRYDNYLSILYNSFIAVWQMAFILIRTRPHAIIGSGPAITVLISVLGKLLGAKIIFVETGSRVTDLSLTGKIMYRIADLFFVQWPPLQETCPKAVYAGKL
jgi:beta-1,4-N-acetylglucosaminyltransferase